VKVLGEVRDRYGFPLAGYVVMPEHIHLLVSEPAKGTPSTIMKLLKQRVFAAVAAQNAYAYKTTRTSFPNFVSFIAQVLAAALLRFQCVESEEVR
jgi:REP element-mobilizing transposase RayT